MLCIITVERTYFNIERMKIIVHTLKKLKHIYFLICYNIVFCITTHNPIYNIVKYFV